VQKVFSRPYLSNGGTYGVVLVRHLLQMYGG